MNYEGIAACALALLFCFLVAIAASQDTPSRAGIPLASGTLEVLPDCTMAVTAFDGEPLLSVVAREFTPTCARFEPRLNGRGVLVWEPFQ